MDIPSKLNIFITFCDLCDKNVFKHCMQQYPSFINFGFDLFVIMYSLLQYMYVKKLLYNTQTSQTICQCRLLLITKCNEYIRKSLSVEITNYWILLKSIPPFLQFLFHFNSETKSYIIIMFIVKINVLLDNQPFFDFFFKIMYLITSIFTFKYKTIRQNVNLPKYSV